MSDKKELTAVELEAQADALLAAADEAEAKKPVKKSKKAAAAAPAAEPGKVLTDEEAKKAGIIRLDDKQVAALPAGARIEIELVAAR